MKTLTNTFRILFLTLAIGFTSCSSDDDNDGGTGGGTGGGAEHFTAKIDGVNFEASTDPASLIGGTLQTNNGMTIATGQGSTNNGDFINFSIINYDGPGTYTTGDALTNNNGIMYGKISPLGTWASNGVLSIIGISPGEIVITSDSDGVLEGSFSFEGYNGDDQTSKMITEGSFKVNLDN